MRVYHRALLLLIFFALGAATGRAQRYLGVATSQWDAINSLYLNPANIADSREKISIGILSVNLGVDNNLGHLPRIGDVGETINGNNNIFTRSGKKQFSMMAPEAVVRGPGVMVQINDKMSIALTTDIRAINQFNNFDKSLYTTLTDANFAASQNYDLHMHNFNWTAHMWSEVGLTFAAVVSETEQGRANLGFTVRRLGGIGFVSVTGHNLDVHYHEGSDSFLASNTDVEFGSNVANDSAKEFKNLSPGGLLEKFFDETAGSGFSADLGFTYRYRIGEPELSDYMESADTHDLLFSLAITDFGAIKYYNSADASIAITGNGYLTGQGLNSSAGDLASMTAYAHQHRFGVVNATWSQKVYLPTAFVASADVQVYDRFYANLLYIANLANRMVFGNSYYNQVSLTPRYDYHKMTISLPITYSMLAHDLKMGVAVRYAGFFIGSDDALAAFSKCQYGFNVYLGGYIPLFNITKDWTGMHWGR